MSTAHQVLKLPETVHAILSNLHQKRDLFAGLQVNTLWAEEATTVLWSDEPPISALVAVHEQSDRLDYYAQKVKRLDFAGDDNSYHHLFVNTSFPRLEEISLDSSDDNSEDVLLQYLQPRLRQLEFYGGPISDAFLMQIQARCPGVHSLLIDYPRGRITADGLLKFLRATSSIYSLCSAGGLPVTEAVWCQLAKQASLESLSLNNVLEVDTLASMVDSVAVPFEHLKSLTCSTPGTNFIRMIPHLHRLRDLTLQFTAPITSITSEISHMKLLREVNISGGSVDPEHILLLAERCKSLAHLEITNGQESIDMNDEVIKRLSELAPQLRKLHLHIQSRLTSQSLRYLGRNCNTLTECTLHGTFDLLALETTGPCLLPHLQALELYHPTNYDTLNLQQIIAVLSHHAPRLANLDTTDENSGVDRSVLDGVIARREVSWPQDH